MEKFHSSEPLFLAVISAIGWVLGLHPDHSIRFLVSHPTYYYSMFNLMKCQYYLVFFLFIDDIVTELYLQWG